MKLVLICLDDASIHGVDTELSTAHVRAERCRLIVRRSRIGMLLREVTVLGIETHLRDESSSLPGGGEGTDEGAQGTGRKA